MNPERNLVAWAIAAVAVAVLAFFAGRELRPERGEASAFDLEAPAYEVAKAAAGFSKAGFTGFGEAPGAEGRTVVSGRIVAVGPDSITIESAGGQRSAVRLAGQASLRRVEAAGRDALRPGVTVLLRQTGGADAAAVLIVAEP